MGVNDNNIYSKYTALHWLAVILFGSIVVWVDSSKPIFGTEDNNRKAAPSEIHAFVAGLFGMFWCIVTICIMKYAEAEELFFVINALLMWIFWSINVTVFTFDGPYKDLKNGWIASWVCFIYCTMHFGAVSGRVREKMLTLEAQVHGLSMNLTWILGCIFASVVQLVAASIECNQSCKTKDVVGYSVAVGVIGILLPLFLLINSIPTWGHLLIAVINFLWWMIALIVLTLVEDFFIPGNTANGYFATWAASIFAILIAFPYLNAIGFEPRRKFQSSSAGAGNGTPSASRPPATSSSGNPQGTNVPYRGTGGNTVS